MREERRLIIGKRLMAIAGLVSPGAKLADIGTDHGYLPAYLVQSGKISTAIAGEVNDGPYRSACAVIERFGLARQVTVRFGDGLAVLSPGEADTVVIAGMGGATIVDILSAQPEVVACVNQLILQPMAAGSAVRKWLAANRWRIDDELLVEDDGKLYEIISAKPGCPLALSAVMAEVGPVLWEKKPPELAWRLRQLMEQKQYVLAEMSRSPEARLTLKYGEYKNRLAELEAMAWQLTRNG